MIDRPDQFEQNIEVLESMYKILAGQSEKNKSSHPDWRVVFCGASMGQIEETQAETNEYLRIPYPLPVGDVSVDLDPIVLKKPEDFSVVLRQFCCIYRAMGSILVELRQSRPRLCRTLIESMIPHLAAVQTALNAYLEWDRIRQHENAMEERLAKHPLEQPA